MGGIPHREEQGRNQCGEVGMSRRLCVLLRQLSRNIPDKYEDHRRTLLRLDLTDTEYAAWFLDEKILRGLVAPYYAINDFALFRLAYDWPRAANWVLEAEDLETADFTLTPEMAEDLVSMSSEGLTDGYQTADWFLRVAVLWCAEREQKLPLPLFAYLERTLFLPRHSGRGRKRSEKIDRDRIIRNAFEGLRLRDCPIEKAQTIIAENLHMSADAVRKSIERTPRTERERRLWKTLNARQSELARKDAN